MTLTIAECHEGNQVKLFITHVKLHDVANERLFLRIIWVTNVKGHLEFLQIDFPNFFSLTPCFPEQEKNEQDKVVAHIAYLKKSQN